MQKKGSRPTTKIVDKIILLGCFTVSLTWRLIQRIKYLEGFLVICSSCKSVRIDDRWVGIEHVLTDNSKVQLSHGLCPQCAETLYGKFLKKGKGWKHPRGITCAEPDEKILTRSFEYLSFLRVKRCVGPPFFFMKDYFLFSGQPA